MKKELIDGNPLLRLSFDFSVTIIAYCEQIEELKKYVLARQLMRSGTSVGANSMEAQNAESKADFIHKSKSPQRKQTRPNIGSYCANAHIVSATLTVVNFC
jgi:hypothetical protein